jgi:hypothetical protein
LHFILPVEPPLPADATFDKISRTSRSATNPGRLPETIAPASSKISRGQSNRKSAARQPPDYLRFTIDDFFMSAIGRFQKGELHRLENHFHHVRGLTAQ